MYLTAFLSWWYGAGWAAQAKAVKESLASTTDYFSITLLLKSLFSPFRQISAGKVSGSIDIMFRAFIDRLVSRVIGAAVRTIIIIIGLVANISIAVFGALRLAVWPMVPFLPFIFVFLGLTGWAPWLN
jgi:hypothetical protein